MNAQNKPAESRANASGQRSQHSKARDRHFRSATYCALVVLSLAGAASAQQATSSPDKAAAHRVAIHVDDNDAKVMNLALNNAKNIIEYYKGKGEPVAIEIVTYGPGLHMQRSDTSPVKDRIAPMALENPNLKFIACANTQANQSKAEGKQVTLISEATVMPSGVVRLIELQEMGYAYIRPSGR